MPPKSFPAPDGADREAFLRETESALHAAACSAGSAGGRNPVRRLNRDEYTATVRDLLNIHIDAGKDLPADGAGGEGFDNAAETLFLSPIHAEKYLDAAKTALRFAGSDPKSRGALIPVRSGGAVRAVEAARQDLERFLPRAFRRPARPGEVARYLTLFEAAQKRGETFDESVLYSFQAVLISPYFLFRTEEPGDYALASRLSYFLWGSMPDQALFGLAGQGGLRDAATLGAQVDRMLKDVRVRDFSERFVEQWLNTRELGRDIKPDPKLFPAYYDAELQAAIRYEPVLFFQELLTANESLVNLIDSNFTILTNKLQRHYDLKLEKKATPQPERATLPPGSHRGGVLTMAAVLAVSSYPHRTSPVLRGKWILEAMLGTPPPPPPPNVPALQEIQAGDVAPKSVRERLTQHRQNAVCAGCHDRIDPLGFALENYDVLGRYRTHDGPAEIDASGQLPGGARFSGPDEFKRVLLSRKGASMRHLAGKMLGYALGRGLTPQDQCALDGIMRQLAEDDYRARTLVRAIVFSAPFQEASQ